MIIATRKDPHLAERLGLPGKFRQGSEGHSLFESIFQAMDRDCSDEVSWQEFENHMRTHAGKAKAKAEGPVGETGGDLTLEGKQGGEEGGEEALKAFGEEEAEGVTWSHKTSN